jgi:hypothetical protein
LPGSSYGKEDAEGIVQTKSVGIKEEAGGQTNTRVHSVEKIIKQKEVVL